MLEAVQTGLFEHHKIYYLVNGNHAYYLVHGFLTWHKRRIDQKGWIKIQFASALNVYTGELTNRKAISNQSRPIRSNNIMRTYNDEDLLGMVELYADEVGAIASEEELSERFDEEVAGMIIDQYGEDDEPAMSQAFNDWADGLCKDGEIHPIQYHEYAYVGRYS